MIWRLLEFISRLLEGGSGEGTVSLVRTAYAPDGRHRVCFFRREEDGVCGFREEEYRERLGEFGWAPSRPGPVKEFRDIDSAVAAAKAEIYWLHAAMP